MKQIDAALLQKMLIGGAKRLEANKEYINELNVFPVPDGDTGTNMTMTALAAAKEVGNAAEVTVKEVTRGLSSGSLRGARGNSGVILSQLFRGFYKGVKDQDVLTTETVAAGFKTVSAANAESLKTDCTVTISCTTGNFYGKNLPFLRLSLFCFITISQMHYSIYYFFLNFSKKYRLPINIDIFYIGSRYFYFILFFSLYHLILRNKYREGIGSFELFSLRYRNVFIRNNVDRKSTRLNSSHSAKSRMPSSA